MKFMVDTARYHLEGDSKTPVLFSALQSIQHLLHQGASSYIMMAAQSEHEHLGTGATSFLFIENQYTGVFMVAIAILIFLFLGSMEGFSTKSRPCTYSKDKTCKPTLANAIFSTVSFLLSTITSVVSGFIGMKITTYANARTTLEARKGIGTAVITAFHSGAVMGFLLAANGLLVLYIAINLFKLYYGHDWEGLFEAITGYGLGGSSMALFGRVGGCIYTKAIDVGTDLVGKRFAICSIALVSLALLVAFMSRASILTIGDKLKLQFTHLNLKDKIHFEGAESDTM